MCDTRLYAPSESTNCILLRDGQPLEVSGEGKNSTLAKMRLRVEPKDVATHVIRISYAFAATCTITSLKAGQRQCKETPG